MPSKSTIHKIVVSDDSAGDRIDVFVSLNVDGVSRSRAKHLIEDGFVRVDGRAVKASYCVAEGDRVVVEILPPAAPSALPEEIPLDVIYEDADIIVVNKPAGMVVHPAAGHPHGTLVNAFLAHCRDLSGIGGELKAGIVHRLDMGTSGAIIAAKNDASHKSLSSQFKDRTVKKIYIALVIGSMRGDTGIIDASIGRSLRDRKRISAHTKKGREALTEWRVIERFGKNLSLLEVRIRTGRTHQIRVHLAEAGHPLAGDPVYGGLRKAKMITDPHAREIVQNFQRPALHAQRLEIAHPRTNQRMKFEARLPKDIEGLLGELRRL